MPIYIQNIATAVPDHHFKQSFLREEMKKYVDGRPATKRIIHRIYSNSGIEKRHTVVNDFNSSGDAPIFFQKDNILAQPSTKTRNDLYTHHAKKLFVDVATQLIDDNPDITKKDITHVITVSCTGFFAPEPAYEIVKQLDLSLSTQRFHIGFMGCFAVFPAIKMAHSFCKADPDATVLIVSVELCSLHLQASEETDQLISASVFADGGAGAIIQNRPTSQPKSGYRIEAFQTTIASESERDMAWTIGDTGFDMVLSTYVPDIIDANLNNSIAPLLKAYDLDLNDISYWAIHPGGRAILDKIAGNLSLHPSQLQASRHILANYGNMSSATILFVLKELLKTGSKQSDEHTLAMAFGPGLTIESALLTKLNG